MDSKTVKPNCSTLGEW